MKHPLSQRKKVACIIDATYLLYTLYLQVNFRLRSRLKKANNINLRYSLEVKWKTQIKKKKKQNDFPRDATIKWK